jgi:hypothetical protein
VRMTLIEPLKKALLIVWKVIGIVGGIWAEGALEMENFKLLEMQTGTVQMGEGSNQLDQ